MRVEKYTLLEEVIATREDMDFLELLCISSILTKHKKYKFKIFNFKIPSLNSNQNN